SETVTSIAVDPFSPDTIYAGKDGRTVSGVFRSTDGGRTWIKRNGNQRIFPVQVLADPVHSGTVYAAEHYGGLDVSTDGAVSFSAFDSNGLSNYANANTLSISPSRPDTLFLATDLGAFDFSRKEEPGSPFIEQVTPLMARAG